ncbi:endopeptidase La [candidate division WOR-3 bacterium]|nr:endopeptidase La [candidate division WOR-3 bacterium]
MKEKIPKILPILSVSDTIVFPYLLVPIEKSDEKSKKLIDDSLSGDKIIGCLAIKKNGKPHEIGTAALILKFLRIPDGSVRILVQGLDRIRVKSVIQDRPYLKVEVGQLKEKEFKDLEIEALMRNVSSMFQHIINLAPYLPDEVNVMLDNIQSGGRLADFIIAQLNVNIEEKQLILEALDVRTRLKKLLPILDKELSILKLGEKIRSEVKTEMGKSQREYYLREQLRAIQKELGQKDEKTIEIEELTQKIKKAKLSKEAEKIAYHELDRLKIIPPQAAEYIVVRTYLDWLVSLPWAKQTLDRLDIDRAKNILDDDHYNLEDVKERILEYLSVRKLKSDTKGPILCFIGPPGVGKTSLGMSIARALGRKFVRFSLGGIRDEAEIRGHRRTYVGALPGRIIQSMRRAGTKNPVIMLDEVDKIGTDFRGDPASALLEVLDPEQNHEFMDHYLDVAFDLSRVMFITTANITDTIPPALLDRTEILKLPGYVMEEKLVIAKQFLIPKQIKENGLTRRYIKFEDETIKKIISDYTREAGVRNLERQIASCIRKVAKQIARGKRKRYIISTENLSDFLGPPKFYQELAEMKGEIGIATGLAWTPSGGEIIFIETIKMKGKNELIITGQVGDIMQESAKAALSYVRSRAKNFNINEKSFNGYDIHIHVPEGSIPKDGPSAGTAITTALVSLFSDKPINPKIAMTGEITLRGKVLPVGGIKEKVLAAKRAGIEKIILPKWNEKDLKKIPERERTGLQFKFIKNIDEVIKEALLDSNSN